jgi:hypothetical protein
MVECRYCGEVFYVDADRVGARCRRCREPLYERREGGRDPREPVPSGQCAAHPRNPAAGVCERCGTFICAVCRTRWHGRALCPACVTRVMDEKEARPEQAQAHRRQALLAVVFGVSAWAMTLVGGLLPLLVRGGASSGLLILGGLLTLAAFLPSLFGVGQAAAAIRTRGTRMIMATFGLVLSAAHVGIVSGVAILAFAKS